MNAPTTPPPGGYPPQQAPHQQPTQPVVSPGAQAGYQPAPGQQYGSGPGFQQRAGEMADRVGRHVKTPETKEFFKTSEFAVWLLTILALLIAGALIGDNGGGDDNLKGATVWTLVTATSVAYIISRGISKCGIRRGHGDAPMD